MLLVLIAQRKRADLKDRKQRRDVVQEKNAAHPIPPALLSLFNKQRDGTAELYKVW